METKLSDLIGKTTWASDSALGTLETIYIDDYDWQIKYIVSHGLISPPSEYKHSYLFDINRVQFNSEKKEFKVNLTKAEIKHAPEFDSNLVKEKTHKFTHKDFDPECPHCLLEAWNETMHPMSWRAEKKINNIIKNFCDEHLHCFQELKKYKLETMDCKHFHVQDLLINSYWQVTALMIDINGVLPGGKAVIDLKNIKQIDRDKREIKISLSSDELKKLAETKNLRMTT